MQKTPKYLQHWRFKCGQVTCVDGEPIGFVTWDPRNRPEYVEIGHNGIREKYKRQGYGHRQLEEAVRRIKEYEGLKRKRKKVFGSEHFTNEICGMNHFADDSKMVCKTEDN